MNRRFSKVYAWALILLFLAGQVFVFAYPFSKQLDLCALLSVAGFALSCMLTPTLHELGHIAFAKRAKMKIRYTKFFIFAFERKKGKLRFSLASPFSAEQTQAYPIENGDMKNRMVCFASGGLIFSGLWFVFLAGLSVLFFFISEIAFYLTLGMIPYAAYLLFLNLPPFEYPSGKSDSLVVSELKKGEDEAAYLLSVMEIYAWLAQGKRFGEIDEKLYFDLPVIAEDSQEWAVMQLLRYRYYLDSGDFDNAASCLNRMVSAEEYLSSDTFEEVFCELVFLHALNWDKELAKNCYERVENAFLENRAPLRIRWIYAVISEDEELTKALLSEVESADYGELLGEIATEKDLTERLVSSITK